MKLSDLDWSEPEESGLLKATYSVALAEFAYRDRSFRAVEWFRRTGHPFHPYAGVILVVPTDGAPSDLSALRRIAFALTTGRGDGRPRLATPDALPVPAIVIEDARSRAIAIDGLLDEVIARADGA